MSPPKPRPNKNNIIMLLKFKDQVSKNNIIINLKSMEMKFYD